MGNDCDFPGLSEWEIFLCGPEEWERHGKNASAAARACTGFFLVAFVFACPWVIVTFATYAKAGSGLEWCDGIL